MTLHRTVSQRSLEEEHRAGTTFVHYIIMLMSQITLCTIITAILYRYMFLNDTASTYVITI